MEVRVECYSGRKADERPVRFRVGGRCYRVQEVVDQWYGPDGAFFKVRSDNELFVLRQDLSTGVWTLARPRP